jgi:hypothetical protein
VTERPAIMVREPEMEQIEPVLVAPRDTTEEQVILGKRQRGRVVYLVDVENHVESLNRACLDIAEQS